MSDTGKATPRPWLTKRAVSGATPLQARLQPEVLQDIAIYPADNPRVIAEVFYRTGESTYEPVEANAALIVEAVNSYDRLRQIEKAAVELAALIAVTDERLLNAAGLAGYKADAAHTNVLTQARELLKLAGVKE